MVKIKTKKEMNFLELVQWAWNRDIDAVFYSNRTGGSVVIENNTIMTEHEINKGETFTVVVEEEITEETKIPLLLEAYSDYDDGNVDSHISKNESIADSYDSHSIAFHMINADGTTMLLWTREGGIVE